MSYEIDEDKLVSWIEKQFKQYKKYHGDYLVNSPFKDDKKFKLSISLSKKCYHCWKTDKSGPLWALVQELDKCSDTEAKEKILKHESIIDYNKKIEAFRKKTIEKKEELKKESILPDFFRLIEINNNSEINQRALAYMVSRRINPIKWKLGYCYDGKYNKRLIIPFYNQENKVYYWTARSLYGQEPKYLNPQNSDKEKCIFTNTWDFKGKEVFVTEGSFNSMVLNDLGLISVAIQGKVISKYQLDLIKDSAMIILAFDNDFPGRMALNKNIGILNENGFNNIKYIYPHLENADWNDVLLKEGKMGLKNYVLNNQKKFDFKEHVLNKLKGFR